MALRPADNSAGGPASVEQLPHDGLAPDIARQLMLAGEYRATFVPSDPQRLVDLRWAALGAGRLLGQRVQVAITRAGIEPGTSPITVRMTCAPAAHPASRPAPRPATRHAIPRQRRDDG
jgi:hypothetical protein